AFTRHLNFLSIWTMDNGHMGGRSTPPEVGRFFQNLPPVHFPIPKTIKPWALPTPTNAMRLIMPLKSEQTVIPVGFSVALQKLIYEKSSTRVSARTTFATLLLACWPVLELM